MPDKERGVCEEHRYCMENDPHYRQVALTPPGTKRHWNSEDKTDAEGNDITP